MRSPNWLEEEVMLALDLYLNRDLAWFNRMANTTREIVALSELLNCLDLHKERPNNFRSVGSIRMKMANFMALDKRYTKKSLGNVGNLDRTVWEKFYKNPKDLHDKCVEIIERHLNGSNDKINAYLHEMNLNSTEKDNDPNFSRFAHSLKRSLIYYKGLAQNDENNKNSKDVIKCCDDILKSLENIETAEDIVFDYEYKEHAGINLKPIKKSKNRQEDKSTGGEEEKIGKFVQRTFKKLIEQDRLSDEMIGKLQMPKYSRDNFGIRVPFLRKVTGQKNIRSELLDKNGHVRYWTKPFKIHEVEYCACKEWYSNQRERYCKWLESVDVHPFYMLTAKELKRLLEFLKKTDEQKINIRKSDIKDFFNSEAIDEVIEILIEQGILSSFQGSNREYVIDDYDSLYRMLNNPADYSGV